ncbi:hypothetical protein B0T26DRAFT_489905 [Lasiosphaeria miniovina]|uniref:Uncharacterized protein n=1 Tax=Lasiosphaeria miniovina TaxID=1954250 RepID=A0AA40DGW9_9PEZI|nr:uncharacterized protein B0T26DRAFT_489905 [Lasiosphaeria miniovina]KAK0703069.1 hypothetical protein B0T26DRAFT_489905 [Lasiosphaeria miniovina]
MKRRNDLGDLCRCIDFRQILLLDDTVTEVILSLDPGPESVKLPYTIQPSADSDADSEYASVMNTSGPVPWKTRSESASLFKIVAMASPLDGSLKSGRKKS